MKRSFPLVAFIVKNQKRLDFMQSVINEQAASHLFEVVLFD